MVDFVLNATIRDNLGKGASRRLRRLEQLVPAIVYGGKTAPQNISIGQNELSHALDNEAFYSHIISLKLEGAEQDVILKDVQRHPAKAEILHIDLLRIDKTQKLTIRVPLHFINEEDCQGVKLDGGLIAHTLNDLEVQCLPANLPEFLTVDMLNVALGQTLHISDIELPEGVESVALSHGDDHNLPVASINMPRGTDEEEEVGEASEEGESEEGEES